MVHGSYRVKHSYIVGHAINLYRKKVKPMSYTVMVFRIIFITLLIKWLMKHNNINK